MRSIKIVMLIALQLGIKKPLHWEKNGEGIMIKLPKALVNNPPCQHAWTFKITNK